VQVNTPYDKVDILTALQGSKTLSSCVNSNDITKALKALKKEIGLINLTGKKEIRKAKGTQKVKFLGSPSLWRFPPNSKGMKKIMSSPKAIELIFRSLINMDYFLIWNFSGKPPSMLLENKQKTKMYMN
jgi:hypothetical protein